MSNKTIIHAPKGVHYLSEISGFSELPVNCLFNKGKTGCGGTELAIRNNRSTIIAMPTVELVRNKAEKRPDGIEILAVYGEITNRQIETYLDTHIC